MIPADHISLNDDGSEAWLVTHRCPEPRAESSPHGKQPMCHVGYQILDRPCSECGGDSDLWFRLGGSPCPDCLDGRHPFTIYADDPQWHDDPEYAGTSIRASVIPGMVLPIHDGYETRPVGYIWINSDGDAWLHDINESYVVTLPPAARAGMWAVKLKVGQ